MSGGKLFSPIDKLGHSSSASWSNLSRVIQLAHSHLNQGFQVFPQIHSAFPSRSHASMTPFPTTYFRGYRSWALTREKANVLIYHEGLHGQEYVLKIETMLRSSHPKSWSLVSAWRKASPTSAGSVREQMWLTPLHHQPNISPVLASREYLRLLT